MSEPKVPTAYSTLRILIDATTFIALLGMCIWVFLALKERGSFLFYVLSFGQIVFGAPLTLVLSGLAHALLDIADAQRCR